MTDASHTPSEETQNTSERYSMYEAVVRSWAIVSEPSSFSIRLDPPDVEFLKSGILPPCPPVFPVVLSESNYGEHGRTRGKKLA